MQVTVLKYKHLHLSVDTWPEETILTMLGLNMDNTSGNPTASQV